LLRRGIVDDLIRVPHHAILEFVAAVTRPLVEDYSSLAKNLRLDKPDILEKSYQRVDGLPRKPCPSIPGVTSVLKLLAQHGLNPKAAQLKTDDVVDMSLCKKFEESGFISSQ
jgi:hypothetical protein